MFDTHMNYRSITEGMTETMYLLTATANYMYIPEKKYVAVQICTQWKNAQHLGYWHEIEYEPHCAVMGCPGACLENEGFFSLAMTPCKLGMHLSH